MNKVYSRINWENSPSEETPLNEANLNKMDSALNEVDNRIVSMNTSKANATDLYNYVQSWSMDEQTGVITIIKGTGEQIIFDLNVEKIPVDFSLSDDGILTMTTSDGSTFTANIGAMIPVLTFADSDEIAVTVSGSGVNKTYSFSIKNGSVTENKLQPNFLADVKVEVAKAESSSSSASGYASTSSNYADISKSYAIGTDGQVRDNDATDNAKYYMEQAKQAYTDVSDKTVTFESEDIANPTEFTDFPSVIVSGEKTSSLMKKFSNFARNIRYIKNKLGNTDLSAISDGTVTGAISDINARSSHVGQIIMTTTLDSADKVSAIYGGKWQAWGVGRVPVGVDSADTDFSAVQKTGGSKTVTLSYAQVGINYSASESDGYGLTQAGAFKNRVMIKSNRSTQAHEILQPYITCYMWVRIA